MRPGRRWAHPLQVSTVGRVMKRPDNTATAAFRGVSTEMTGALVLLDAGAAELLKWAGGLSFLRDELGARMVLDLGEHQLCINSNDYERLAVVVTSYVWEYEHFLSRLPGPFQQATIFTSLSLEAHTNHPLGEQISRTASGDVFSILQEQLRSLPSLSPALRIATLPVHAYTVLPASPGTHPNSVQHEVLTDVLDTQELGGVLSSLDRCPSVFVTCNLDCARVRPLQLSDVRPQRPTVQTLKDVIATDIPSSLRMRYRLLSHVLGAALREQMKLDVSGNIFALGKTAELVGTSLGAVLEHTAGGSTPGSSSATGHRPAALVLIDRSMDLSTALAYDADSLFHKLHAVLPRTGHRTGTGAAGQAHLADVGVNLPQVFPPLDKYNDTQAFPALATFPWQGPPSLCHPTDPLASAVARAMACCRESDAQALLRNALNKLIDKYQCTPPPPKRRGPGAEIMALITSISSAGPAVCHKCRGVLQVALAVVDTLQRLKDSSWDEVSATQKVIRQTLVERGDDVAVVGVLLKAYESRALSPKECVSLTLFALALHGDELALQLKMTLRDALARRVMAAAETEEQLDGLLWLPEDLKHALMALVRGDATVHRAALEMELQDVLDDVVMLASEDAAVGRRHLRTACLRNPSSDDMSVRTGATTLVGRLMDLLLRVEESDPEHEDLVRDLARVGSPLQHLSRAGFGLIASGIGKLGGVLRGPGQAVLPSDRPLMVVFVIGGIGAMEVREVTDLLTEAEQRKSVRRRGRLPERVFLGGTALCTPSLTYEQIFCRGLVDKHL